MKWIRYNTVYCWLYECKRTTEQQDDLLKLNLLESQYESMEFDRKLVASPCCTKRKGQCTQHHHRCITVLLAVGQNIVEQSVDNDAPIIIARGQLSLPSSPVSAASGNRSRLFATDKNFVRRSSNNCRAAFLCTVTQTDRQTLSF